MRTVPCRVAGCINRVRADRAALGYTGCKELHQQQAPARNLIPLPKGNTVVAGADDNLRGIANSHKTGVVEHGPESYSHYRTVRPRERYHSKLPPAGEQLLAKLRESGEKAGGVYIDGEPAMALAYRLGWATSRVSPCRLTQRGLLARAIARAGRVPQELS